jgi:hypothetical protein
LESIELDSSIKSTQFGGPITSALKTAFAYCDKAYDGMTDASVGQIVKPFGTDTPKLGVLNFNTMYIIWNTTET